jgi:hypothetical protein
MQTLAANCERVTRDYTELERGERQRRPTAIK